MRLKVLACLCIIFTLFSVVRSVCIDLRYRSPHYEPDTVGFFDRICGDVEGLDVVCVL